MLDIFIPTYYGYACTITMIGQSILIVYGGPYMRSGSPSEPQPGLYPRHHRYQGYRHQQEGHPAILNESTHLVTEPLTYMPPARLMIVNPFQVTIANY